MSLRIRVAIAAAVTVGSALAVVGLVLVLLVADDQVEAVDDRLVEQAHAFDRPLVVRALLRTDREDTAVATGGGVARLVAADGTVLGGVGDAPDGAFPDPEAGFMTAAISDERWRVLTVPAPLAGSEAVGQVATSLEDEDEALATLRRRVIVLSVLALVAAAVAGLWLGGRALRPLGRLKHTAAEVAADADAARRVPSASGITEVDGLAETLNDMLARLETALTGERAAAETARQFAANAAHELRTPLTALTANLHVLERPDLDDDMVSEVLHDIRSDTQRLAATLGALEQLARSELHPADARQIVDLDELLDAAVTDARRRHPDASITLVDESDDRPAVVSGWAEGLRVLCDNLLDNAALHGRPTPDLGASVQVRVSATPTDVVLTVADSGPGIPESERHAVVARFSRGSKATAPGSGLGLALVDQQVRLHGGSLEIDEADGGGCRISVRLPCGSAPDQRG